MTRCTKKNCNKFRFTLKGVERVNDTTTLSADEYYLINIKID
jgi:hypothetical protein